jgi:hypothetical protein
VLLANGAEACPTHATGNDIPPARIGIHLRNIIELILKRLSSGILA